MLEQVTSFFRKFKLRMINSEIDLKIEHLIADEYKSTKYKFHILKGYFRFLGSWLVDRYLENLE